MNRKERALHITKVAALCEEVLDKSAEMGQATKEQRRASFIADGIAKSIFRTGKFIHALNNIAYNPTNNSILVVCYPVANDNIDEIIRLVKTVRGVKSVSDNPMNDEETMVAYHVLKVKIVEEAEGGSTEEIKPDEVPPISAVETPFGRPEGSSPVFGPGMS
jgi:hypothetical protein